MEVNEEPGPSNDSSLQNSGRNSSDESDISSDEYYATDLDSDADPDYDTDPPVWSINTAGMRPIPFVKENGFLVPLPAGGRPIDFFFMLIDEIFLEHIVRETNRYALEVFFGPSTTPQSRITRWKDLTVEEIKIFIGLLLHTGTIRMSRIQDYWRKGKLFGLTCFSDYMSRDRFLMILRCLHFSNNALDTGDDRLFKVRGLVDYFNNKMNSVYYPQQNLSLDECMVLWRGRLFFRQYIKGKRHKYGIKLYTLSEPHGIVLRFLVYCGVLDDMGGKGHAANVVLSLMQGKLGNGHSLYMDNYYNSFTLAAKLLSNGTYCTGTLRSDRKHVPMEVKKEKLKTGETIARYAEGVMIGKWKDKREVTYISTEFENCMASVTNKRGEERMKPEPIIKYNAFMKGIDRGDQMMAYYPSEQKTVRWYKKVFIHVLQMLLTNSYFLYNECAFDINRNRMSLYQFRLDVIDALLPDKPASVIRLPRNAEHTPSKNDTIPNTNHSKRKRCRVCSTKGKKTLTTFVCRVCPGEPGLCVVKCFDEYHKN